MFRYFKNKSGPSFTNISFFFINLIFIMGSSIKKCLWAYAASRGWGGGGGGYGCASQYFKTYPIHIPGLRKNGSIHILDHPKC